MEPSVGKDDDGVPAPKRQEFVGVLKARMRESTRRLSETPKQEGAVFGQEGRWSDATPPHTVGLVYDPIRGVELRLRDPSNECVEGQALPLTRDLQFVVGIWRAAQRCP
jgi:hypothetical protein